MRDFVTLQAALEADATVLLAELESSWAQSAD